MLSEKSISCSSDLNFGLLYLYNEDEELFNDRL